MTEDSQDEHTPQATMEIIVNAANMDDAKAVASLITDAFGPSYWRFLRASVWPKGGKTKQIALTFRRRR